MASNLLIVWLLQSYNLDLGKVSLLMILQFVIKLSLSCRLASCLCFFSWVLTSNYELQHDCCLETALTTLETKNKPSKEKEEEEGEGTLHCQAEKKAHQIVRPLCGINAAPNDRDVAHI